MSVDRRCVMVPLLRGNRRKSAPRIAQSVFVLFVLFLSTLMWSQAQNQNKDSPDPLPQEPTSQENPTPQSSEGVTAPQEKKDDSQGKQTKRMFGVVPNFAAVSAHTQLPPLSTREKFSLAAHDSIVDYS